MCNRAITEFYLFLYIDLNKSDHNLAFFKRFSVRLQIGEMGLIIIRFCDKIQRFLFRDKSREIRFVQEEMRILKQAMTEAEMILKLACC